MRKKFTPIPALSAKESAALTQRVTRSADGCWIWQGWKSRNGYGGMYVSALRRNMIVHRLAYFNATGIDPGTLDVDHMCHQRACINPAHLRAVPHQVNSENRAGLSENNTSGVRGVHWDATRKKWMARIKQHGVAKNLGRFDSLSDAESAVRAARADRFALVRR